CIQEIQKSLKETGKLPAHLDSESVDIKLSPTTFTPVKDPTASLVSTHAYLGSRGIVAALDHSADYIICGRVADASPVIGAAQWWHGWSETTYDELPVLFSRVTSLSVPDMQVGQT